MELKYLVFATVFAMLSVGCSDKKEVPNELKKQSEMKEKILENSSDVIDIRLEGPKSRPTHGKLCLEGCRGLPCDEKVRCVKRNCPSVNVTCEDGEHEVFKDEEKVLTVKPHKKILCQKGCDDVPENSAEYKDCVLRNCPDAKFVLKMAVPSSSSDRGVKKIIPVLEKSHDHCKGDNECFCKKSNFSGSVTIGNTKYHCR